MDECALEGEYIGTTGRFFHTPYSKGKQAGLRGVRISESDMCGPTILSAEHSEIVCSYCWDIPVTVPFSGMYGLAQ